MRTWCKEFVEDLSRQLAEWPHGVVTVRAYGCLDSDDPDYVEDMSREDLDAHLRSDVYILVDFENLKMRNVHVSISLGEDEGTRYGFINPAIQGCGCVVFTFHGPFEEWVKEARYVSLSYGAMMQSFERDHLGRDIRWANPQEIRDRVASGTYTQKDVCDLLHDLSEAEQTLASFRVKNTDTDPKVSS